MLCLPLGGVSLYEVLATYLAMAASIVTVRHDLRDGQQLFHPHHRRPGGLLPDDPARWRWCASCSTRPAKGMVAAGDRGRRLSGRPAWRPASSLFRATSRRLLHPPDVGAEAKEVVDPDLEQRKAVGMVIRSDQFPDRLFAPPKRDRPMADRVNPVYDKEMRSELFGQGTLMLRLVIQLSMFLALPLMAVCLYMLPAAGRPGTPATCCCSTCWSGRSSRPAA